MVCHSDNEGVGGNVIKWPPLSIHKKEADIAADLSSFIRDKNISQCCCWEKPIVSESVEAGAERGSPFNSISGVHLRLTTVLYTYRYTYKCLIIIQEEEQISQKEGCK